MRKRRQKAVESVADPEAPLPIDSEPLPDPHHYRHAGQKVGSTVLPPPEIIRMAFERALEKNSVHPVINIDQNRYMLGLVDMTPLKNVRNEEKLLHDALRKREQFEQQLQQSEGLEPEKLDKLKQQHAANEAIIDQTPQRIADAIDTREAYLNNISQHVSECYLLPYYEREHFVFLRQEKGMLTSRIDRFFELAQEGIRAPLSSEELLSRIEHYRQTHEGGAELVGGIMDRLGVLGSQIIDMSRPEKEDPQEPEEARRTHIAEQLAARRPYVDEFNYFSQLIAHGEFIARLSSKWDKLPAEAPSPLIDQNELMASVQLRKGGTDRDGLLGYFAREVGKLLTVETSTSFEKKSEAQRAEDRKVSERTARDAVTTNVVWACGAIDHARAAMDAYLLHDGKGQRFLSYLKSKQHRLPSTRDGLTARSYDFLLKDFTDKARARAVVRLKDSEHFKTIDEEFLAAEQALGSMHSAILTLDPLPEQIREAVILAQQGTDLIANMARSRMPRDHNAPAFASVRRNGAENSSVGIFENQLSEWSERSWRVGAAQACSFTDRELRTNQRPAAYSR